MWSLPNRRTVCTHSTARRANGDGNSAPGPAGQPETIYSLPCVHNDLVFIGDRSGYLHCLNLETGLTIWKQEMANSVNATATVFEELVITATNAGNVQAFAKRDGRRVWKRGLDGPSSRQLFLVNGHLVATADSLYYLDPLTGKIRHRARWRGQKVGSAAAVGDRIALFLSISAKGLSHEACKSKCKAHSETSHSETLLLLEEGATVREIECSKYRHDVRFSSTTGLLYASGLAGFDILDPETGVRLYSSAMNACGVPEVTRETIFTLDNKGTVSAMAHPY